MSTRDSEVGNTRCGYCEKPMKIGDAFKVDSIQWVYHKECFEKRRCAFACRWSSKGCLWCEQREIFYEK
jgi:hypothetical protein